MALAALVRVGVAAAALGCAAPASAATVQVVEGGVVDVAAAAGEANRIAVSRSGSVVTVTDAVTLVAGAGCARPELRRVTCSVSGDVSAAVALGDLGDTLSVSGLPAYAEGGDGADQLAGGSSDDVLDGGAGDDRLAGGGGADVLDGDGFWLAVGGGDDVLDGGAGADRLTGDGGVDLADYATRGTAVRVTLDGIGDDGGAEDGAGDTVDVENVRGGGAADVLVGDDLANELDGGGGADDLRGGGGDDALLARDGITEDIDCGAGTADRAVLDTADTAAGCETTDRPAPPPPPPSGDTTTTPPPSGGATSPTPTPTPTSPPSSGETTSPTQPPPSGATTSPSTSGGTTATTTPPPSGETTSPPASGAPTTPPATIDRADEPSADAAVEERVQDAASTTFSQPVVEQAATGTTGSATAVPAAAPRLQAPPRTSAARLRRSDLRVTLSCTTPTRVTLSLSSAGRRLASRSVACGARPHSVTLRLKRGAKLGRTLVLTARASSTRAASRRIRL